MVRADIGEALVPIIAVIVWIVSSIARAGKQGQPAQRERSSPTPSPSSAGDPQEQLRDFLEQLSGQSTTPAEPSTEAPAGAPDLPADPVPAARPIVRDAPQVRQQTQRVPSAQPVTLPPLAADHQTKHEDRSYSANEARSRITQARGEGSASYTVGPLRRRSSRAAKRLIGDLAHPNTARKAILLREVLGPPLGLQDRRI